ncbi:membrane protein insertase YidC [Amycolatopsis acidicola]|uniref:Membrane protein insertase YidC n=1 Tax=Amycolatopsis acidicola TaxID=2596893 RepID=A0A5N0UZT7_9PSEU|nr:membrane protein insertase YidC [Amycolatopsis acidicola]KAA9157423.1 membrane protein insertase YidC [Amycolatopsis acidicola]
MFDFLLFPVSAILWLWHQVFGFLLGPDNGFAWALAVFFLVFTLRALLLKPTLSQLRAAAKMREAAPRIKELREKHRNDPQRLSAEMKELGVNPVGSCLMSLVQLPVFFCLYTVLRDFHPDARSNFVFDRQGVLSFVRADIFGARLGNWLSQPASQLATFGTDHAHMLAVGIPLMLLTSLATFVSMKISLRRQAEAPSITKALVYLAPLGVLVSGSFFPLPLGVLLYFLAQNLWTLGQTWVLRDRFSSPAPASP